MSDSVGVFTAGVERSIPRRLRLVLYDLLDWRRFRSHGLDPVLVRGRLAESRAREGRSRQHAVFDARYAIRLLLFSVLTVCWNFDLVL